MTIKPSTAAISIEVVGIPPPAWRARVAGVRKLCRAAAEAALAQSGWASSGPGELTIVLADDTTVRRLNKRFRGQDKPTNVLSFPARDPARSPSRDLPQLLGDVVLACETVAAEADAQKKALADHLRHLVVHGVLHLLGYDHEEPAAAEAMEGLETRVLKSLGVADPYCEALIDG